MTFVNLTNITLTNSTLGIFQAINFDIANGLFFTLILIALFVVLFVNYSNQFAKESLVITMFIVTMIAGLLWLSGLIPLYVLIVALFVTLMSFILFFVTD